MKTSFKRALTLVLLLNLLFISQNIAAQDMFGIGASGIYNWQSEGIGIGVRAHIPLKGRWAVVPQVTYFPPFNIVNEYFFGVNFHYNVLVRQRVTGYVAGGGHINIWANASESPFVKAKTLNVLPEASGGLIFGGGCFRPFVEHRYNPIWKEGSTHIGLLWFPRCSGGGAGAGGRGSRVDRCPAYN